MKGKIIIGLMLLTSIMSGCGEKETIFIHSIKYQDCFYINITDYICCAYECNEQSCEQGIEFNHYEDCKQAQTNIIIENYHNNYSWQEEKEDKCWQEGMKFCSRLCSDESGLILSDSFISIDTRQFDKNKDGNFSEYEIREWDYIDRKYQRCMQPCIEEEIYPCYN